jgi:hypothetical protein
MIINTLFLNLMAVKLQLGNAVLEALASCHLCKYLSTRSWSFGHRVPKRELGNEHKPKTIRNTLRPVLENIVAGRHLREHAVLCRLSFMTC